MHTDPISNTPATTQPPAQDPTTFGAGIDAAQTVDLNIANATRPLDMPLLPDTGVTVQTTVKASLRDEFQTQTDAQVGMGKFNLNLGYDHNITPTIAEWANKGGPQYARASLDYRITDQTAVGVGQRRRLEENDASWVKHKPTYTEAHVTHTGERHITRTEIYIDPKLDHGMRFTTANTDQSGPRYQINADANRDKDVSSTIRGPGFGSIPGPTLSATTTHIKTRHRIEANVDMPIAGYIRLGAIGRVEGTRDISHTHTAFGSSHPTQDRSTTDMTQSVQYGGYLEAGFLPEDETVVRVSLMHTTEASSRHVRSDVPVPAGVNPPNMHEYAPTRESLQLGIGVHGHNAAGTIAYGFDMGFDTRLVHTGTGTINTPTPTGNGAAAVSGFTPIDAMYITFDITADLWAHPQPKPKPLY
jgi:hypothetical protein